MIEAKETSIDPKDWTFLTAPPSVFVDIVSARSLLTID